MNGTIENKMKINISKTNVVLFKERKSIKQTQIYKN